VKLLNSTKPPKPPLPESDVSDMEDFIDQIKIVLPVLGHTLLKPVLRGGNGLPHGSHLNSPIFFLNQVGIAAKAMEVDNDFVVLKGSFARKNGVPSWDAYVDLRKELVQSGKIIESDCSDKLVFTQDVPFRSPSAAAACVLASNRNGRTDWKVEGTNQTYEQWERQKLNVNNTEVES